MTAAEVAKYDRGVRTVAAAATTVVALVAATANAADGVPLTVQAQSRSGTIPAGFITAMTVTDYSAVIADGFGISLIGRKAVRIVSGESLTVRASHQLVAARVAVDQDGYQQVDAAAPRFAVDAPPGKHLLNIHLDTTTDASRTASDWAIPLIVLARPAR